MEKYNVQPLDLMQFINAKYHDPFIHELFEFEGKIDTEKLALAVDKVADVFPLLKCCYDKKTNTFIRK
ncbi:MAG: hypothetical protein ACI4EX_13110 [Lachnospiraceae bacterium]